jgi:hypothetical protein
MEAATAQPNVSWTREAIDLFTLCCTKPLLTKVGRHAPHVGAAEPATTRLGNWYAAPVVVGKMSMVVCASEASLLPLVVKGAEPDLLVERVTHLLGVLLQALDAPEDAVARELREMAWWQAAPTANPSLLATVNGYRRSVEHWIATTPGSWSLAALNENLATRPSALLEWQSPGGRAVELLRAAS